MSRYRLCCFPAPRESISHHDDVIKWKHFPWYIISNWIFYQHTISVRVDHAWFFFDATNQYWRCWFPTEQLCRVKIHPYVNLDWCGHSIYWILHMYFIQNHSKLIHFRTAVSRTVQWRHNERHDVSNHLRLDCLLKRLVRRRSKKTSKQFRVTGLCEGNPPVTGAFPSQRASTTEKVSIRWRRQE